MTTSRSDKLNSKQRRAISEFEDVFPFDFMYIEDINAGRMSFAEAWHQNEQWARDWLEEGFRLINLDGCGMLKDF